MVDSISHRRRGERWALSGYAVVSVALAIHWESPEGWPYRTLGPPLWVIGLLMITLGHLFIAAATGRSGLWAMTAFFLWPWVDHPLDHPLDDPPADH